MTHTPTPDEKDGVTQATIDMLYMAYRALLANGWQEIMYAPKDGTEIEIIEMGSMGIHKVAWSSFNHEPLDSCGCFFGGREGYPSHPVLFRTPQHKGSRE